MVRLLADRTFQLSNLPLVTWKEGRFVVSAVPSSVETLDVSWSRRAAAGRAQLLAKRRHIGRVRLPAELLEVGDGRGRAGKKWGNFKFREILRKNH